MREYTLYKEEETWYLCLSGKFVSRQLWEILQVVSTSLLGVLEFSFSYFDSYNYLRNSRLIEVSISPLTCSFTRVSTRVSFIFQLSYQLRSLLYELEVFLLHQTLIKCFVKKNLEQFKVGLEYRRHKSECHLLRTFFWLDYGNRFATPDLPSSLMSY